MLKGEPELDPALEEDSQFETGGAGADRAAAGRLQRRRTRPSSSTSSSIDECHRSIYTLWRQVLEYFDAFLIGLTATPAKQTFGFFNQNLVMEYAHEQAVADGVNVDFEVYRIRTQITEQGATVEARARHACSAYRDRQTRAGALGSARRGPHLRRRASSTAASSPRTRSALIVRTFRDRLLTEIFPGRTEVPEDADLRQGRQPRRGHRRDRPRGVRQGQRVLPEDHLQGRPARSPRDLIQAFRNSYHPRIAVTVDMIATGTDIKPVEIVMFMRAVKSRVLFEQMKGRGVRVIDPDDLQGRHARTPTAKTHFVIVDCVGVTETGARRHPAARAQARRCRFKALLEHVALGRHGRRRALVAGQPPRAPRPAVRTRGAAAHRRGVRRRDARGRSAAAIVDALDAGRAGGRGARATFGLPAETRSRPTAQVAAGRRDAAASEAAEPLATKPDAAARCCSTCSTKFEQIIDEVSQDELLEAGASARRPRRRRRRSCSRSSSSSRSNKDEIDALQFFYSRAAPASGCASRTSRRWPTAIKAPPRSWTPERLWRAYETLEQDKVRGASGERLLTDIVSLVRFALHQDDELVPFAEQVRERFERVAGAAGEPRARRSRAEQRALAGDDARPHRDEPGDRRRRLRPTRRSPRRAGSATRGAGVRRGAARAIVSELNEVLAA